MQSIFHITQDQYIFVYDAVRELLLLGDTTIKAGKMRRAIRQLSSRSDGKNIGYQQQFDVSVLTYFNFDEIMCWLLRAIVDHKWMVSIITVWGVRWTGLPHSQKNDGDHLIKDNQRVTKEQSNKWGRRKGGCRWVSWLRGSVLVA